MSPWGLIFAGWDPSAGAGSLADLETFRKLKVEASAALTAVTAQNHSRVVAVHPIPVKWVWQQVEALLAGDRPSAIKIGMLGSGAMVRGVAKILRQWPEVPVVLDPVLRATAGAALLDPAGIGLLRKHLLGRSTVITPNVDEAERLLDRRIGSRAALTRAAQDLLDLGPRAVVITGGDRRGAAVDVFCDRRGIQLLSDTRIKGGTARGTGCRFSSALAAYLARGLPLPRAARLAKSYVRKYLISSLPGPG